MRESQHPDPGSGMNNPDHIFLELRNHFFAFSGVKILKVFDEDPGSGINIPDPQHLLKVVCNEKEGGPGKWQTFAIGLGLVWPCSWRSWARVALISLSSFSLSSTSPAGINQLVYFQQLFDTCYK
jgi:hypothetical protein